MKNVKQQQKIQNKRVGRQKKASLGEKWKVHSNKQTNKNKTKIKEIKQEDRQQIEYRPRLWRRLESKFLGSSHIFVAASGK